MMKKKFFLKTTLIEFISESMPYDDIYGFKEIPINITDQNYKEAIYLRNKFGAFRHLGVGTFLTTTFLWRVVDENELNIIINTKKIIGGEYSVKPERYFGASFSGSRADVVEWGIKVKKNGRYKGNLYVIGINAEDKEFLNLNMVERLKEQGISYEIGDFTVNSKLGDIGLGFSVRNVTLDDVRFIYKLDEETRILTDITYEIV